MRKVRDYWILLLLILSGLVIGGFIGSMATGIRALSWLNYGDTFGLTEPFVLDLGVLIITFGLKIKITIASIFGVLIGILAFRLI